MKHYAVVSSSMSLCCLLGLIGAGVGCSSSSNGGTTGTGGAALASGGAQGTGTGGGSGGTATGGATPVGSGGRSGSGGANAGSGGSGAAGTGGADAGSGGAGIAGHAGTGGAAVGSGGTAGEGVGGGSAGGAVGSGGAGGAAAPLSKFSFFVTSLVAMRALSKSQDGFGGDLRYGQADGLSGADKICSDVAESSMPGSSVKQWRAFLSVAKGPAGTPINAADRIGAGPWYDRLGRLVAMTLPDLLQNRPTGADPAIKEDLPNESGIPNHRPDPAQPEADNHHVLTGSDAQGKLYAVNNAKPTCMDWTTTSRDNTMTGRPRIGFSWSISNRTNWISGQDEGGCGTGVAVNENGASDPSMPFVGSGGGYGGIYCFALAP